MPGGGGVGSPEHSEGVLGLDGRVAHVGVPHRLVKGAELVLHVQALAPLGILNVLEKGLLFTPIFISDNNGVGAKVLGAVSGVLVC